MATEFKLPELGENVEAGDVVRVLVSVGESITRDQPVLELETEKAMIEVPSPATGRVEAVAVQAGDRVTVGQVILVIEDGAADSADTAAAQREPRPSEAALEVEQKPPLEMTPRAPAGKTPKTAEPVGRRTAATGGRGEVVDISRAARPAAEAPKPRDVVLAAPSVRRLAREIGVDIDRVSGSGPGGRIMPDDVKVHARRLLTAVPDARPGPYPVTPLPDFTKWGEIERQPMSSVRRKTAVRMSQAWANVPHVTQHDKADITALEQLRVKFAKRGEHPEVRLTVTAFALKVVAAALKRFPQFNASVDMANEEIIYKRYVHIGVAVDTDRGLLVPVLRSVDTKSVLELSTELADLAERARSKKLTFQEMEGGTFTITNLGGLGGTYFSPLVNFPEVAVLGLSRGRSEPVLIDGRFEPRLLLPLSLSYDHRVIDGADAVRFVRWIVGTLEQPFLLQL